MGVLIRCRAPRYGIALLPTLTWVTVHHRGPDRPIIADNNQRTVTGNCHPNGSPHVPSPCGSLNDGCDFSTTPLPRSLPLSGDLSIEDITLPSKEAVCETSSKRSEDLASR